MVKQIALLGAALLTWNLGRLRLSQFPTNRHVPQQPQMSQKFQRAAATARTSSAKSSL